MPKKLPYKEFQEIYSKVTRLCVDILILSKQGVLLTERTMEPYKGKLHIPGCTVLVGESLEEAAIRCAKEELSMGINIQEQVGVIEYDDKNNGGFGQSVSVVFLCTPVLGEGKYYKQLPDNMVKEQRDYIKAHVVL